MEEMKSWLESFPGWGQTVLHVDLLPAQPANAGLYPRGDELLQIRKDLLGNVRCRCRRRFDLLVTAVEDKAQWLEQLADWVARQSALGLAPRLGDEPKNEHIRAEKGGLKERTAAGTAVYAVTITAEFVKKFMEENYG